VAAVLDRLITGLRRGRRHHERDLVDAGRPPGSVVPAGALPASGVCKPEDLADHPLALHYLRTADPTPVPH